MCTFHSLRPFVFTEIISEMSELVLLCGLTASSTLKSKSGPQLELLWKCQSRPQLVTEGKRGEMQDCRNKELMSFP